MKPLLLFILVHLVGSATTKASIHRPALSQAISFGAQRMYMRSQIVRIHELNDSSISLICTVPGLKAWLLQC